MDKLYEAMPIPSFSDEDDGAPPHHQSHGRSSSADMNLDVSAHGSFTEGSVASSANSLHDADEEEREEEGGCEDNETATHRSHHRVFNTTSSPEELYAFLTDLQRLAESLLQRLHKALGDNTQGSCSSSSKDVGAPAQGSSLAPLAKATGKTQQPSSAQGSCHGAAKLRSRRRNEVECVRRAVEGLRSAGCTSTGTDGSGEHDGAGAAATALSIPPAVLSAAVACAQCNSLAHFEAVVACLEWEADVTGVYVPISGHVGPPQRRPASPAAPSAATTRGVIGFPDHVRIEVDVVSNSEHRWIKVKTATPRSLEVEAAALEMNGSTPFTDMLAALCERARHACLPHRRVAHVSVVFLHPPPLPLRGFLTTQGITWVCLATCPLRPLSGTDQIRAPGQAVPEAWLPRLVTFPTVVCLDTTALVTLCSQSCYADAMPVEVRLERLAAFHVLCEQQRKEAAETPAVSAVMEPVLRQYTQWCTRAALNEMMREAMLRDGEVRMPESQRFPCASAAVGTPPADDVSARASVVPEALLVDVDMTWLGALQHTAQTLSLDAGHQGSAAVDESPLLCEYSARCSDAGAAGQRPGWIIADVTYEEFRWILETIAGPAEVARAARLLSLVTVVRTDFLRERMKDERDGTAADDPPAAAAAAAAAAASPLLTSVEYLRVSGKVSLRNKVVFGLADAVGAVIVTSNEQLCHAAREQGVVLAAALHPSRSLTEQKMYALRRRPGPGKPPAV